MAWVTPEQYFGPDINPNNVHTAVGRALNEWETMEHHFSMLYTFFWGRPRANGAWVADSDKLTEYGMNTRGFDGRMDALCAAGKRYFELFPSQQNEGTLDVLINEARPLSQKRHQIAHSIVAPDIRPDDKGWPGEAFGQPPTHYGIMAPWYAAASLTKRYKPPVPKGTPVWLYCYRIKEIDSFAAEFRALSLRIAQFIEILDSQN